MNQAHCEDRKVQSAMTERWLGIDFSGNIKMWKAGCRTSNVWIADIRKSPRQDNLFCISDLKRLQQLPGTEAPFIRLARMLSTRDFSAAAIDAPFSIPASFVPRNGHSSLLAAVSALGSDGRLFGTGKAFVDLVKSEQGLYCKKPLRATEAEWIGRKVNIRSTMWAGARGGAPMTAACLTLLHLSSCPIWPWNSSGPGLLIEAFPAGQLRHWELPFQQYNGRADLHRANRKAILHGLSLRVDLAGWEETLLPCADAIDAIVCALTAASITLGNAANTPDPIIADHEGWIAVSR
jgi:hypothetical protein